MKNDARKRLKEVYVREDVHHRLKVAAVHAGQTIGRLIERMLEEHESKGAPPRDVPRETPGV